MDGSGGKKPSTGFGVSCRAEFLSTEWIWDFECVCDIKTGFGVSGSFLDVDFPPQGRTDGLQRRFFPSLLFLLLYISLGSGKRWARERR